MTDESGRPSRRQVLKGAAAFGAGVGFVGNWRWARAQAKKPLIIGLTCDATGTFADSGQADRRGMILAIEEQNAKGGVLGRPVEARWEDTETDPSVAVRKAQKLIERDKIDFMIGALSSGVAAPLSELAQRYGIVYFNSNSSADTVSGEKCQRVNFVWDANGYMFNQALGPLVAKNLGKKWFLLTHDYVWGKNVTAGTRDIMKKVGAEEAGELMVPQGTRDFSAQLLRIRSAKPEVVFANVAGIEQTALREQANEFGSEKDAHWVFPQQDYPDLFALGAKKAFGYFTTTWHYNADGPGVAGVRPSGSGSAGPARRSSARQRVLQRLHRHARAAAGDRAGGDDAEPRGHQGARGARHQGQLPQVPVDDPGVGPPRGPDALPRPDQEGEGHEGEVRPDRDHRGPVAGAGVAAARSLEVQDAVHRRHPRLRRVGEWGQALSLDFPPGAGEGRGVKVSAGPDVRVWPQVMPGLAELVDAAPERRSCWGSSTPSSRSGSC